jgi:hypothetical protein
MRKKKVQSHSDGIEIVAHDLSGKAIVTTTGDLVSHSVRCGAKTS